MAKRGRPKTNRDMLALILMELEKPYLGTRKIGWISKGLVNACLPRGEDGKVSEEGSVDLKAVEALMNRVYGKPAEKRSTQLDVFHHYPQLEAGVDLDDFKTIEMKKSDTIEGVEARVLVE